MHIDMQIQYHILDLDESRKISGTSIYNLDN